MKRRLPIGIQDFRKIREQGCVYVDKTERIHSLVTGSGGYFFLSRPRRFGKSLLCSTLAALFEGHRDLFGPVAGQPALAIDSLEWEWKKYPVIHIDLSSGEYAQGKDVLNAALHNILTNAALKAGQTLRGELAPDQFANLIFDLYRASGQRVVVIIDEYDNPLLSTIDIPDIHKKIRESLGVFYGVLKSSDQYLKMGFITGITKFSQVSVFSRLNNLTDISLDSDYHDICGITPEELEHDFAEDIETVLKEKGLNRQSYLDKVKRFYNGYRFSKKTATVYNPYGLLSHFNEKGEFNTYWYASGTPSFLVRLIEAQKIDIPKLEKRVLSSMSFQNFNTDNMNALAVLYQTGYLTIVDYNGEYNEYTLDYPNEEVRASFANTLLDHYTQGTPADINALAITLPRALNNGDVEAAMNALPPFFAAIPYDIQLKHEKYYQTLIHLIFRMIGLHCQSEIRTADGRVDTLVETKDRMYCFEFKLHGTAQDALDQIDRKEYLLPWTGSAKQLYKIGVSFDFEKRNINEWKVVSLE